MRDTHLFRSPLPTLVCVFLFSCKANRIFLEYFEFSELRYSTLIPLWVSYGYRIVRNYHKVLNGLLIFACSLFPRILLFHTHTRILLLCNMTVCSQEIPAVISEVFLLKKGFPPFKRRNCISQGKLVRYYLFIFSIL